MGNFTSYLLLLYMTVVLVFGYFDDPWRSGREKGESLKRFKRRWVLSTIELEEEDKGPFPRKLTQFFNDQNLTFNPMYKISGEGVDRPPYGVFSINDRTCEVYVHKSIDREKDPLFHIMFDIMDKDTKKVVDKTLSFDVAVLDINDNPPVFDLPLQDVNVKENLEAGDLPVSLTAVDPDQQETDNSRFAMRVVSQEPASPKIGIKTLTGTEMRQLTFTGCFDFDKVKNYKVIVEAKDMGTPSQSSSATINLHIVDTNTHLPVFKQKGYKAEVMELVTNEVILRIGVEDKDTPNTSASKAKFIILKGNEEGNYKIETDPVTNEGILTVVKGMDFEKTTSRNVEISVENEEPLFVCKTDDLGRPLSNIVTPKPQSVTVGITVIDENDPPEFKTVRKEVFLQEESDPGQVLLKPVVIDAENNTIRYEIAQDPEKWVKVDPTTGVVTTIQKMDRESPYVNNSIYTILIHAIDNGKPPATGTGTLIVHLDDINDNLPILVSNNMVMCVNEAERVEIQAKDKDNDPFEGPFIFSLRNKDETTKSQWALDPDKGNSATLVSLKSLPYGNYTVPLKIEDKQGKPSEQDLQLEVCDCGGGKTCRILKSQSSSLGGLGIATLVAGILLLMLLLCLCLLCQCGGEKFLDPLQLQDEGNQTLIKYNEEGGGSVCKAEPTQYLMPSANMTDLDGLQKGAIPISSFRDTEATGTLRGQGRGMGSTGRKASTNSQLYQPWNTMTFDSRNGTIKYKRSLSLMSERKVTDQITKRLEEVSESQMDGHEYDPHVYAYEGAGSTGSQSLDELSLGNSRDNLDFLQDLGPRFNTLEGICLKAIQKKNSPLSK